MKRLRTGRPALLALFSCAREPSSRIAAPVAAAPAPEIPGVEVRTIARALPTPLVTHVVTIDLAKAPGVLKVVADRDAAGHLVAATVRDLTAKHGLSLAVNASFFRVPDGKYPQAGERAEVVGGLILEGKTVAKGKGSTLIDGALCLDGRTARIEKGFECKGAAYGVASGPVLLLGGQRMDTEFADKIFKSLRHPRTAVGVDAAKKKVWFLVADGRQEGVSEGATLDELKEMLQGLGATDAINLDGGGSSTLVVSTGSGPKVVNVPIHDRVPGRERPVADAVGMTGGE